jgi:hypothetical protein
LILSRYTELNADRKILVLQLNLTLPPQPPPRITAAGHIAAARHHPMYWRLFDPRPRFSRLFDCLTPPVEKVGLMGLSRSRDLQTGSGAGDVRERCNTTEAEVFDPATGFGDGHAEIPSAALGAMICAGPPDYGSVGLTPWRALPSISRPADRRV